jgi:hypothetical protein
MQAEMKKAFMRGVCALNLEAMTMFKPGNNTTTLHSTSTTQHAFPAEETTEEVIQTPPPSYHRNDNPIPGISASLHLRNNVPPSHNNTTAMATTNKLEMAAKSEATQIFVTRHKVPNGSTKKVESTSNVSTLKTRTVGRPSNNKQ